MKRLFILFSLCVLTHGCTTYGDTNKEGTATQQDTTSSEPTESYILEQGYWLGQLNITQGISLPFNLEVSGDSIYFINAEEKIGSVITSTENQLVIEMPVFDSEFRFSKTDEGLFGFWHNRAKGDKYLVDFKAEHSGTVPDYRFNTSRNVLSSSFDGKWEVSFSPGTDDEYKALGIFNQDGKEITGTFITETGDYRFLQGNVVNDSVYLSCFDGSHAFLFTGELVNGTINGMFYSGTHWSEPWSAKMNEEFHLRDPFQLTEQVNGQNIEFSFPNLDKEMVTYPDPKYSGKVVIIQLLGSWCPNCMDETKFLTELHNTYGDQGLEIIGLAFEAPKEMSRKIDRVTELKNHFGAEYEFLIAGNASKREAEEALPFLNQVMSFPTTIFIDKDGVVRKIHTGFYGPGTGQYYIEYVSQMDQFVSSLLKE